MVERQTESSRLDGWFVRGCLHAPVRRGSDEMGKKKHKKQKQRPKFELSLSWQKLMVKNVRGRFATFQVTLHLFKTWNVAKRSQRFATNNSAPSTTICIVSRLQNTNQLSCAISQCYNVDIKEIRFQAWNRSNITILNWLHFVIGFS